MRATAGARVAAVALLLGAGTVGLRAWQGLHVVPASGARLPSAPALIAFTALETAGAIIVLVVLPAVIRRSRRRRRMATEFPGWATMAALLLGLVLLAIPLGLLLMASPGGRSVLARLHPAPPPALPDGPRGGTPPSEAGWLTVALTTLAVVAAILLFLRRARRAGDAPRLPRHPLAAAVGAGQDALDRADGPRAAVIACYAAMERALSQSGAAPRDADTPAEVLDRAARAGLVRSGAATTLTRLFHEARYSHHPMGEEHRRSARSALRRLRHDLEPEP